MSIEVKAKELVDKFRFYQHSDFNENKSNQDSRQYRAKQCALICVDEILELQLEFAHDDNVTNIADFYKEVKQEINKL